MSLGKTLRWAREEWGIVARRDQLTLRARARWLRQWVPFGARTVGYGLVSVSLGPLTSSHAASRWAMRRWCRSSLRALRISVAAEGTSRVPSQGGFVYASNHQSLLDILVLGAVLPGDFKWAAKRSLMNIPFLGWHLRLSGHVPVDRGGDRAMVAAAIERFAEVLREGKPLLIFPEGTRSTDAEVRPFKAGGFIAAVKARCPVVPVALDGTFALMASGALDTGDTRAERLVRVAIGEPLTAVPEGTDMERAADLGDRCRAAVVALHDHLRTGSERA